jgi:signal transduction histidine kinase
MSIRLKTILGIAIIEALLLLLLVSMTLDYLKDTNYESIKKRAESTVSLFAATASDAVLSYDLASLESLVQQVSSSQDLVYARVLSDDGEVLSQAGNVAHLSNGFNIDNRVPDVNDGVFDTYAYIDESGVIYGRVELGLDTNLLRKVIDEAMQRSAIIAAIEMGLVALFSFILGTYLTQQLKVLVRSALKVSSGNLNVNVPVKGKDEIAAVAGAFNIMIANLKEANLRRDKKEEELQELNQTLEERVLRRTQQLAEQNALLEKTNLELIQTQKRLVQTEKMASIGLLSAGIAHEINNPLSYTISNLNTLGEYAINYRSLVQEYEKFISLTDETEKQEQLEHISALCDDLDLSFMNEELEELYTDAKDGIGRVKSIVKGMQEFSHVEKNDHMECVDINECINHAVAAVKSAAQNKQITLLTDLQPNLLTYCSSNHISQALQNIFLNAVQASQVSGEVSISSQETNKQIQITVTDQGCGIAEADLNHLFDPFYTTQQVGKGVGLGLAISYGVIVDGHNGDITVKSEVGEGSCFIITIPIMAKPYKTQ